MKWDDWLLRILIALLLAAMLATLFLGRERSRHGYGALMPSPSGESLKLHYTRSECRMPTANRMALQQEHYICPPAGQMVRNIGRKAIAHGIRGLN